MPRKIGELIHFNLHITSTYEYPIPKYLNLKLALYIPYFGMNQSIELPYQLSLDETNNEEYNLGNNETCPYINNTEWFGLYNSSMKCCPYYTPEDPCSDRIAFIEPFHQNITFEVNETRYTLYINGFIETPISNYIQETFITQEKVNSSSQILASMIVECSPNTTCDDGNQCTLDLCENGFCFFYHNLLIGMPCSLDEDLPPFNEDCYQDICTYFKENSTIKCMRHYENCTEESSEESFPSFLSSDLNGDDDDDDEDWTALYASLAALAGLCLFYLLLALILLPLLFIPPLLLILGGGIAASAATAAPDPPMGGDVGMNPLYDDPVNEATNPIYS
jgi:hypothetical protein